MQPEVKNPFCVESENVAYQSAGAFFHGLMNPSCPCQQRSKRIHEPSNLPRRASGHVNRSPYTWHRQRLALSLGFRLASLISGEGSEDRERVFLRVYVARLWISADIRSSNMTPTSQSLSHFD